jgi:hypothetical protein
MKYRKLRIAWSVALGIMAVLLIVLWVRSYWRLEQLSTQPSNTALVAPVLESLHGRLWFIWPERGIGKRWLLSSVSPEEYWRVKTMADVYRPKDVIGFGFGYYTQLGICFPHWFLAVVSVALAAALWIQWAKLLTIAPWFRAIQAVRRFSLRTLLLATTLVAIGLGLIGWLTR